MVKLSCITILSSPDSQYQSQTDYFLCNQRWRSSIQSAKTRRGADCGSDHELLIAYWDLNWRVGKTTRSFRYDLNQTPYDYTVEVTNRFRRLDLIDRVADELWMEVRDIVQETGIKTIPPKKRNAKRQNGCLLLLPPIPPSIRVFSNESALCMRGPKYWSFSFSISPYVLIHVKTIQRVPGT